MIHLLPTVRGKSSMAAGVRVARRAASLAPSFPWTARLSLA
jgi:hypothetical protein